MQVNSHPNIVYIDQVLQYYNSVQYIGQNLFVSLHLKYTLLEILASVYSIQDKILCKLEINFYMQVHTN